MNGLMNGWGRRGGGITLFGHGLISVARIDESS